MTNMTHVQLSFDDNETVTSIINIGNNNTFKNPFDFYQGDDDEGSKIITKVSLNKGHFRDAATLKDKYNIYPVQPATLPEGKKETDTNIKAGGVVSIVDGKAAEVLSMIDIPAKTDEQLQNELDRLVISKRNSFIGICESKMSSVTIKYPRSEMDTWDQQIEQARRVVSGDPTNCDMLQGIADARGITLAEQATRVVNASNAYTALISGLIGVRQKLDADIDTILDDEVLTVQEKIDGVGLIEWPEE